MKTQGGLPAGRRTGRESAAVEEKRIGRNLFPRSAVVRLSVSSAARPPLGVEIRRSDDCSRRQTPVLTFKYRLCARDPLQSMPVSDMTNSCDATCDSGKPPALHDISNHRKATTARDLVAIIRKGKFDEFLCLLESKPAADVNTFVNGNTALHYCLMFGRDVSWCKQLVMNGANPNLSNQDGWHPIHLAAYCGRPEILTYLMKCNTRTAV